MYKCSSLFVLGLVLLGAALGKPQQPEEGLEYNVDEPQNQDVDFSRVRSAGQELLFNFNEMIVNPNEKVQLDCGIKGDYRYCVWEKDTDIFQVQDVYEDVYSGMGKPDIVDETNQCGIVVDQATIEDHGIWTCKIYIRGTALVGSKNVVITVKPTQAEVSPQQVTANADELQEVECSVMAARPAVKITWKLNGKDVTSEAMAEERPTNPDGTYMTLSTLSRVFKPEENGQNLECVVAHHTLLEPEITAVPITVVFAPVQKQVQTFYQIPVHSDYEIRLNFSANPRPTTTEWSYGANFQEMPNAIQIPSDDGKFATSLIELENGNYQALLKIVGIAVEDFETKFKLHVANDIGEADYRVMLSMDEKPIDDAVNPQILSEPVVIDPKTLSGGAIAAIVIVLLLVVVVIAAAGYARYKQMFCFAPAAAASDEETKEVTEEHDTESARQVTPNPASNLFNRLQQFIKPKKEQDQKLEKMEEGDADEGDEKAMKEEEGGKNSPRELSPDDKKESKEETKEKAEIVDSPPSNNDQKSPKTDKSDDKKSPKLDNKDQKSPKTDKPEVVYAELDLAKGDNNKDKKVDPQDKTEYAQIVGTVTDNKDDEKKE